LRRARAEAMLARLETRKLSLFDATMMVMGGIIGVGIFFNPERVASQLPSGLPFLGIWALGGLVALCGAFTFAELGATFPQQGGWYVFLREAFGRFPAFLFAWVVLFAISGGSMAVVLGYCVDWIRALFPGVFGESGARLLGALIIASITAISMLGVKVGARFQNLCMLTKLVAIAALVIGALTLAGSSTSASVVPPPPASGSLVAGFAPALLAVFFTYGGWQMVCYVAPQVRDPVKTLPRSITVGVLGVVAVYLIANWAFLHALGMAGIAGQKGFANEIAVRSFGPNGSRVLLAAMVVSAIGIYTVNVITTPWLYVAMAREGLFFRRFAELHPRTGAPMLALWLQATLTLGFLLWGNAGAVADSVVFVEWVFHALVALALLSLRARRSELPRPFRSPLYPLAPLVYLGIALYVLVGNLVQNIQDGKWDRVGIGCAVIAAGALIYLPWRWLVARAGRA
jgi:basic amino acid/polyamine antiporter, APA family